MAKALDEPGMPCKQPIGRRKRLLIKLHAGVLNALGRRTHRSSVRRSGWWRSRGRLWRADSPGGRGPGTRLRRDRFPPRLHPAEPGRCGAGLCRMRTMLLMWPENVDSDCCKLCSSPMSAKTWSKTFISARAAGTWRPHCAISVSRPVVLRLTVLPPVFGPVISRILFCAAPSSISIGTTICGSIRGWRADSSRVRPAVVQGRLNRAVRFGQFGAGGDKVYLAQRFGRDHQAC